MTTCTACGTALPEAVRFCHECGAAQQAPPCSSCGVELSPPGARFCSECGAAQHPRTVQPPATVGTGAAARRVTSVLFGDLVGFTALSESRDQEEVRELLSRYFDEARTVIGRYGGTVEKFIGDAVMAVWGVPTAHEDDAERAVRAGLELVNAVAAFGADHGAPALAMRVGIVTGEVAVTIGAEQQGMVAGDPVNTAARVQAAAEPGQVWVDETTRLLTSSAITYLDVGSHAMKGKAEPVPLWSVRAVVAAMGGAQRADGLEAPLVGRDRELRLFKELFHAVEETRRPALLVVDGEPGVGKTRLAWEFEKYVDGLTAITRWHSGRCVAYGEGVAYFALSEAVRGRLRAVAAATSSAEEDDLAPQLEQCLDRYVTDTGEREWLRSRVGALLGIGSVGTFPREDLFSAWSVFLERVGEGEYPVVLVIDDAQHADEGLLLFVEHLLSVASFAGFVVLLTRPGLIERFPALATNRRATVVHLPTLPDRDVAALLDGLVAGLPDPARDRLVERSEGVPLFAVETVRSLIDRDLVVPRGGQYVLAEPDRLDLDAVGAPASLQALIAARLDTLSADQRRLVDRASVLGTSFPREAIAGLCEDLADVDGVLTELVRLQILSQDSNRLSAEYGHFQFVQSAVRQVAYATLSRRDRKAIHLAVVAQDEAAGDDADDTAAIRAQHYIDAIEAVPGDADVAELRAAAIANLRRAGARARALGSPAEAAGHLRTALSLAEAPGLRATLEHELAGALADAGKFGESAEHAGRAVELFVSVGDRVAAGLAAAVHSNDVGVGAGDNERAVGIAEPWWEELRDRDDATEALLALTWALGSARSRLGLPYHDLLETRLRLAERAGRREELADGLTALSVYYAVNGVTTLGRVLMQAAADIARQEHHPTALSRALVNLTADSNLDDLHQALEYGREALAVGTRSGVSTWISYAWANLLAALWSLGEWAEVDAVLAEADIGAEDPNLDVWMSVAGLLAAARGTPRTDALGNEPRRDIDDPAGIAWADFADALQARQDGDLASAARLGVEACRNLYALSGVWDDLTIMWPVAVDLAELAGDAESLAALLELVDGEPLGIVPSPLRAHRLRVAARISIREGGPVDGVESDYRDAIARFTAWGSRPYRARTEAELGAWLLGQGRVEEGQALLEAGRAALRELGADAWLAALETGTLVGRDGGGSARP